MIDFSSGVGIKKFYTEAVRQFCLICYAHSIKELLWWFEIHYMAYGLHIMLIFQNDFVSWDLIYVRLRVEIATKYMKLLQSEHINRHFLWQLCRFIIICIPVWINARSHCGFSLDVDFRDEICLWFMPPAKYIDRLTTMKPIWYKPKLTVHAPKRWSSCANYQSATWPR